MTIDRVIAAVAALLFGSVATAGHLVGPDWKEGNGGSGDAGAFPSSAQVPTTALPFPAQLRTIAGALDQFSLLLGTDQQDVYAIYIDSPITFQATTDSTVDAFASTAFNSQLFLFNSAGLPVVANDGFGDGATIMLPTFALTAGVYYIAISVFNSDPLDASFGLLFPDIVGPQVLPSSSSVPAAWSSSALDGGNYTIALTGAVFVPAPGAALLLALGAGLTRRRRSLGA